VEQCWRKELFDVQSVGELFADTFDEGPAVEKGRPEFWKEEITGPGFPSSNGEVEIV
jgi:hypothetical protein